VVDCAAALWPPLIIDLIIPIAAINHPPFLKIHHDKDGKGVAPGSNEGPHVAVEILKFDCDLSGLYRRLSVGDSF
jgi:hypothetical protein